jgi:tetratricopeptide (TPR) repeat protein
MVRRVIALLAAAGLAAPPTVRAERAPELPLVIFFAPAPAAAEAAAARGALARLARAEATALVDLSPALPPAPTAPARLRRAIEAYEAFRYDEALGDLDQAIAEAASTGAAGLEPSGLSDLLLYRALCHVQRGDATRAWDDFVRAATADPARLLDPLRFPPRAVEAFQRAVLAVRAAPTGRLVLDAARTCSAWIDGRAVPATNEPSSPLPHGEHYLRLECPGLAPYSARFSLATEELALKPDLRPPAQPSERDVIALGRTRGASAVLLAVLSPSAGAPATLRLSLLDVASGSLRGQSFVALAAGGTGDADTTAAAKRLLDRLTSAATAHPPPPMTSRSPWYRSPWLWGAIGVSLTAAVLLPLTVDVARPAGFDLRPDGPAPW